MPQRELRRSQGTLDVDTGNVTRLDLSTSHLYKRLVLDLDWDVDSASGDSQSGEGILDLIQRIRLVANNQKAIKDHDMAMSHKVDHYKYGTEPLHDTVNFGGGTGQTGTVTTFLDFIHWPGNFATALPSWTLDNLELEIHWGTDADVGTSANTTINSGTSVEVVSEEIPRRRVPAKAVENFGVYQETQKTKTLDSSGITTVELPRGPMYRAIPMLILDNDSADDALVSDVEVIEEQTDTHLDLGWSRMQDRDKVQYGVESILTGFTIADFGEEDDLDRIVPTHDMGQWELDLDTGSTSPTSPAEARVLNQTLLF